MRGGTLEGGLHSHGTVGFHREPLGHDRSRPDEELGPDEGEGKLMCPQSASSPGVEVGCHIVRRVRSRRIPRSNEISSLTLRALR